MKELKQALDRLTSHFDVVTVKPPASPGDVTALRDRFGRIPDDVVCFYSECNGIAIGLHDDVYGNLFPLDVSMKYMPVGSECGPTTRLLPVQEDGCGNYDCLVLGEGVAEGSVVFWDHEVYEGAAYLLGGTLSSYFCMWADNLVTRYFPDGEEDPKYFAPDLDQYPWIGEPEMEHPWPFDEQWMRSMDSEAAKILDDPEARSWVLRQDHP